MNLTRITDILLDSMCEALSHNLMRIDNSLYSGKMGVAILFYNYAKFSKNEKYNELADKAILNIVADIEYKNRGLALGISGIGWGLSYLTTNEYIDIDNDFIITRFNAPIIHYSPTNIDLFHGQIGKGIYLCNRLQQLQKSEASFEATTIKIDIIRIINEIDINKENWMEELRMYHFHEIENLLKNGEVPHYYSILRDISQSIIFLNKVYRLGIYPNVTTALLKENVCKIDFCLRLIEDHYYDKINSGNYSYLLDCLILELSYALWLVSDLELNPHNIFNKTHIEGHISKILNKGIHMNGGKYLFYTIRTIQSLIRVYHKTKKMAYKEDIGNLINAIFTPFVNEKKQFEMDLFNTYNLQDKWAGDYGLAGLSGLGLLLLSLQSDCYLNWDEAIGLS
ncbi:hypothetical protein DVR12_03600 [Chitinophaga silvatica]|uniref:Lanthionine synthetase C-like protein n=1 Tax=Chitinophaga silvatica TaxID=2282649 RepID=A0A3E1YHM6_9BACT|nr:lanthionine synthetase LanC family protein [Chitinophaga silvatica]RFS26881.1 hypothetical protein DVR12_03600 [Chitinophaga silvatica]